MPLSREKPVKSMVEWIQQVLGKLLFGSVSSSIGCEIL